MLKIVIFALGLIVPSVSVAQEFCNEYVPWYVERSGDQYLIKRISSFEECVHSHEKIFQCGDDGYEVEFEELRKNGYPALSVRVLPDERVTPFIACEFGEDRQT